MLKKGEMKIVKKISNEQEIFSMKTIEVKSN